MNHNLLVGLSTLAIVATGCGSEIPAENSAVETAAQLITEEFVREIIAEISSDEYQGEDAGWDGTYNGQDAPNGAYVYNVKYRAADGQEYEKKGTITLTR